MRWFIDTLLPNFTVTRRFDNITEYIYGSKRYLTDVWPPDTTRRPGFPIRSVIRDDGVDVTKNVLKFSGPMRNYVHPLGVCLIKKKISVKFQNFGIRFELCDYLEMYSGTVYVTDIFGQLRTIHVEQIRNGDSNFSS